MRPATEMRVLDLFISQLQLWQMGMGSVGPSLQRINIAEEMREAASEMGGQLNKGIWGGLQFYFMSRRRSKTLTKAPEESAEVEEAAPPLPPKDNNVKIYLRRVNKSTKIVTIPPSLPLSQLALIVHRELSLAPSRQVLFFKGSRIPPTNQSEIINFQDKNILHVHTSDVDSGSQIQVILQYLSEEGAKAREVPCCIRHSESIRSALRRSITDSDDVFNSYSFVQSGRKLSLEKKYFEEFIEDGSIITVISRKAGSKPPDLFESLHVVETPKVRKQAITIDPTDNSPSFKKKSKMMCVYKPLKLPESKEVVWESDSGSEWSKKELLSRLYRKKNRKASMEKMEVSSLSSSSNSSSLSQGLSLNGKMELREEIKKLFLSDCLHNQSEVKRLKPPKIQVDDYLDEGQEIEIAENDESGSSSSEEDEEKVSKRKKECKLLYSSLPLNPRMSIGKTKGIFSPLPLIPTRDFEEEIQMEI